MTCPNCQTDCQKHGKDRKGNQRFKCLACSKTFIERATEAPWWHVLAFR